MEKSCFETIANKLAEEIKEAEIKKPLPSGRFPSARKKGSPPILRTPSVFRERIFLFRTGSRLYSRRR